MIPPPNQHPRIVRSRIGDAEAVAQKLADPQALPGFRLIKATERTSVFECELPGSPGRMVIVKTMQLDRLSGLAKSLFKRTRLMRQWRGAELLMDAGIDTAEPLLFLRGARTDQGGVVEALVLEKIEGEDLLHVIARGGLSVEQEHALAIGVGEQVATLVSRGIFNRDHKPSNVLAAARDGDLSDLAIVDTVGIEARATDGTRMLATLCFELIGTDRLPRRAILMRACTSFCAGSGARRKSVWTSVRRRIDAHGDCAPEDDPLADL